VMNIDLDGRFFITALLIAAKTAAIIAAKIAAKAAIAAVKGAVVGAVMGGAFGGVVGGITSAVNGGCFWSGFGSGALTGMISGAIMGAAIGGAKFMLGGSIKSIVGTGIGKAKTAIGQAKIFSGLKAKAKASGVTLKKAKGLSKPARKVSSSLSRSAQGFTKSNTIAGQKVHKGFMKEVAIRKNGKIVARLNGLKRKNIFELKPYNPQSILRGINQLKGYKKLVPGTRRLILVVY